MRPLLLIPVLVGALCPSLAHTQTPESLELRGVVYEAGPNVPLPDAQITIYQFANGQGRTVLSNLVTDSRGAFRLKLARPGDYYVEAAKPSYVGGGDTYAMPRAPSSPASTTGTLITLNHDHPSEDVRLALIRYGELAGKIVDGDDKPVAGLEVEVIHASEGFASVLTSPVSWKIPHLSTTAADGTFHVAKLIPGKYTVRVSARAPSRFTPTTSTQAPSRSPMAVFSEDDEKAVDEAFAPAYWPGVPDQAAAATIVVNAASVAELGAMRIRKERLYRVHLLVRGCEPGDQLTIENQDPNGTPLELALLLREQNPSLPCGDLLLPALRPGSYQIVANTSHSSVVLPVSISDRNQAVPLVLVPNSDIPGRVVTVRDVPPPERQSLAGWAGSGNHRIVPDAAGNFVLTGMPCRPAPIQIANVAKGYYVRELRIDGETVAGEAPSFCGGTRLEIVLDNKVASLNISISDGDKPANAPVLQVQRWPQSLLESQRPAPMPNESGTFQLTDLPPGEYRLLAVRNVALPDGAVIGSIIGQLWDRATKVTIAPGETKSVSVKLIDPFQ